MITALSLGDVAGIDLLTISRSSDAMGRGGAFLADNESKNLAFLNFACLGDNQKISGSFMSGKVFNEVPYNTFSMTMGNISVGYFGISEFAGYIRDEKNNRSEEIVYTDTNVYAAAGFDLNSLDLGLRLRSIQKGFSAIESGARASLLDVSIYYQLSKNLSIGGQMNNMLGGKLKWTSGYEETLPTIMGVGVRYKLFQKINLYGDMMIDDIGGLLNLGGEYLLSELLTVRGGINQEHGAATEGTAGAVNNFTFGLGLNIGDFFFDYSYYVSGMLSDNSTHYFSLSYQIEQLSNQQSFDENSLDLQEKIADDVKNVSDYSDNWQDISNELNERELTDQTKQAADQEAEVNTPEKDYQKAWEELDQKKTTEKKEKEQLLESAEDKTIEGAWD